MVEGSGAKQHGYSRLFVALLIVAISAAVGGLWWSYHLSGRLTHAEAELTEAQQQNQKLASALNDTNARLKVNESLRHKLGATQKQLERRARSLLNREQTATPAEKQQQSAPTANNASGAAQAAGDAQTGLSAAEAQLQRIKGDAGVISVIATNQQELEVLKQKGDHDYYEFTLEKGKKQTFSNVGLELRKADEKDGRFSLFVYTDNVKLEKKDRDLDEPVQFYIGADNLLCDVVVNRIQKNQVSGYLAIPKNVSAPATAPQQP